MSQNPNFPNFPKIPNLPMDPLNPKLYLDPVNFVPLPNVSNHPNHPDFPQSFDDDPLGLQIPDELLGKGKLPIKPSSSHYCKKCLKIFPNALDLNCAYC